MNNYEVLYILSDKQDAEARKALIGKFQALVEGNGEVSVDEWGSRKLAYPIQKKSTGFYAMIEFDAPADIVKKLETAYRRDARVIRFLTFRLDKYAAEYAAKRRSLRSGKVEKVTEEVKVEEVKEN